MLLILNFFGFLGLGVKNCLLLHLLFWVELQVSLCLCLGEQVNKKHSRPRLDNRYSFKSSPKLTPAL